MHLVDEPRAEVLPDRGGAAAEPNVLSIGGSSRAFQRAVNPMGHEVESRAALHGDRCARVVGKHEIRGSSTRSRRARGTSS
jgi:hypothetical protein